MKKHTSHSVSMLLLILLLGFATLGATTLFKPIRASINKNYTYSLDGKQILKNKPMILYKGQYYAPIDSLTTALGYNIALQEDQALITTPGKPSDKTTTLDNAVITAIDFASNQLTIYPKGKPNNANNQIVLNITPNTIITDKQGNMYDITALTTDMVLQATYSSAMTMSIPPQSTAIKLVIQSVPNFIQPR